MDVAKHEDVPPCYHGPLMLQGLSCWMVQHAQELVRKRNDVAAVQRWVAIAQTCS